MIEVRTGLRMQVRTVASISKAGDLGAKDLINNRMAYVAVSRGAHDAQIFTNDREKLPEALSRDVSHQSAHMPEMVKEPVPEIAPERELSYGFGIEM